MTSETTTVELLAKIDQRLGQLVALQAAAQIAGLKQTPAIERLGSLGFSAKEISEITGFAQNSVAPILSRAKSKTKSTRRTKEA